MNSEYVLVLRRNSNPGNFIICNLDNGEVDHICFNT